VAVTGRTKISVLEKGVEIVKKVVDELQVPPSIRVRYAGVFAEAAEDFRRHATGVDPGRALVFTVLLFEFRSFSAPVAIVASALLSTSGVFFALLITGKNLNVSSFMGLIMVIGIVAKNESCCSTRIKNSGIRDRHHVTP